MLGEAGLVENSRVIMEKPFGADLETAVTLNAKVHEVLSEEQIFRIDHFLGEEKNKVFSSMLPIQPSDVVRGQFIGYRDQPGVNPESDTETFIALKCCIDNWRWAGVLFYLRTGQII